MVFRRDGQTRGNRNFAVCARERIFALLSFFVALFSLHQIQNQMDGIEIKEILSSQIEQYKMFLATALQNGEENLLITLKDNLNAPFPTKDRKDSFTLGAYAKNGLAGVASFTRDGEDREKLRHKGMVSTMYVAKDFRGRGIARQLLEEIIRRVKALSDIEQINLIVVSDNLRAKRLYEKLGFEKFGTEKNSIKWKDEYLAEDQMVLVL
jgi:ribosomal protein S18 acetylase RimI-like enzyme